MLDLPDQRVNIFTYSADSTLRYDTSGIYIAHISRTRSDDVDVGGPQVTLHVYHAPGDRLAAMTRLLASSTRLA